MNSLSLALRAVLMLVIVFLVITLLPVLWLGDFLDSTSNKLKRKN